MTNFHIRDVRKLKAAAQALVDRGFKVWMVIVDEGNGLSYITTDATNGDVFRARREAL